MNRYLRYMLIGLAVILALLIIAPFFIPTDSIRQAAEEAATEAAGMKVKIAGLSLKALPTPGISLSGVKLKDVKGGTPKVAIASGRVSVAIAPLFSGRVELTGIKFRDIVLRVSEKARGKGVHTVHINKVTGSVKLDADKLEMPNWKAKLYDGTVRMNATVSPLQGKRHTLSGKIKAGDIQIQPLLRDAAGQKMVSGTFSSELSLSAKGATETAMQRSLKVDGPARLTDGKIEGMGLEGAAASALLGGKLTSGPIVFETMQTQLKIRGQDIVLKDIDVKSPIFDARGKVHILPSGKMEGEIETSGLAGLAGSTLIVGGTVDSPRIYPETSSLIGGALGTVGGPVGAGVGGKIGGQAGDIIEGVGGSLKGLLGQ
ncbi:MAG: AsmA family protein [Mariprofundaceae bacterium]